MMMMMMVKFLRV